MAEPFEVIDLFAGPGGLGEGFSAAEVGGRHPFRIRVSVEKDAVAHRTLRLRAFLRAYREQYGSLPDEFLDFHAGRVPEPNWPELCHHSWDRAETEALCLELGTKGATQRLNRVARSVNGQGLSTVLIGGPPCQAYSIAGRVRSNGIPGYVPENDGRHYLFREYVKTLKAFRPVAFVMENVKGILSSAVGGKRVLDMVLKALARPGGRKGPHYDLFAIQVENGEMRLAIAQDPVEYVLRAEEFGVPQARHRVFIVGIRSDMAARAAEASFEDSDRLRTVEDAIGLLAPLRSGLSRGVDSDKAWRQAVTAAAGRLASFHSTNGAEQMRSKFGELREIFRDEEIPPRSSTKWINGYGRSNDPLRKWIENPALEAIAQHEARSHMNSDIERYMFASVFAETHGHSPKSKDFPRKLAPNHRNWKSGAFADRFRVQLADEPATTITSHISKDGHHYIHYDPLQCRSMTVREAARLQTFPDDYFFLGNRTQQYVQVGNAVPPYLARKIALLLHKAIAPGG